MSPERAETNVSVTPRCFVICPIGDRHAPVGSEPRNVWERSTETWEKVIVPACEEVGMEPLRADRIAASGEIPEQVFRKLRWAPFVVADVTGGNANVMYELGLRHTTGLPTVQIGERGRLPFDISAIRTVVFGRTEGGLIQARKQLVAALAAAQAGASHPVTATRVWFEHLEDTTAEAKAESIRARGSDASRASESEDQPGFLEKLAEAEEAMPLMAEDLSRLTAALQKLGYLFSEATEQARQTERSAARLAIAERLARDSKEVEEALATGVDGFQTTLRRVSPGIDYIITRIEEGEEIPQEFVDTFTDLAAASDANRDAYGDFLDALSTVGKASRGLKRVTTAIRRHMDRFFKLCEKLVRWRDRLLEATDQPDTWS